MTELDDARDLGVRLRAARRQRRLSLQQAADASGISKSFLSVVETGGSDITFGRLLRLLAVYRMELADLMNQQADLAAIVRADARRHMFSPGPGVDEYLVAPDMRGDIIPALAVFQPGAAVVEDSQHDGDEWLFVLEGSIELVLDGGEASARLYPGDSAYVAGNRPHRLANSTDAPVQMLSIVTQPARPELALAADGAHTVREQGRRQKRSGGHRRESS